MTTEGKPGLDCPIGLFSRQEEEISRLTAEINRARSVSDKASPAQALIVAAEVLLACESYDENRLDCRLCHNVAALRQKTATLIIQARRLADPRRR